MEGIKGNPSSCQQEVILMETYSLRGTLIPTPPFDFEKSLDFIEMFRPMSGEQTLTSRSLSKAVSIHCKPVIFQVNANGSVESPAIEYQLYGSQPLDAEVQRLAEDRIAFFLSLNDDLRPFYAIGLDDPFMAPLIHKRYGLHQVKFLTPFEIAVWSVLVQRLAIPIAKKIKQALVERYGGNSRS
jgi:DNA-3-methyladenine glycosylase II